MMSGEIWLDGQAPHTMPPYQAAQSGVQLVPEDRRIIGGVTVEENLILAQIAEPKGWSFEHICLHYPMLAERRGQIATTLSGGEQQILAIIGASARDLKLADRAIILDTGNVAFEGSAHEVLDNKKLREEFLAI